MEKASGEWYTICIEGGFYAKQQQQVYPRDAGSDRGVYEEREINDECSKQVGNKCAKQEYLLFRRNIYNR